VAIPPPTPVAEPVAQPETTNLHHSSRVKKQPTKYERSMTGTKYYYAAAQLAEQAVLYPNAHMFVQDDFYQVEPDIAAAIMTQLLLKAGLREWGDQGYDAAHSEMKPLHMHNTFKPKHWHELTPSQRNAVLESHMFLKEKRSGKTKG